MSEQVTMTAKEREEWEAFKAEKEKRKRQNGARQPVPPISKWSMRNWRKQFQSSASSVRTSAPLRTPCSAISKPSLI